MNLRLIEMSAPRADAERMSSFLNDHPFLWQSREEQSDDRFVSRVLLRAEDAEKILDSWQKLFESTEGNRLMLLPVEATLPRPKEEDKPAEAVEAEETGKKTERMSREELYADIEDAARLTRVYVASLFLSSIVAIIGVLQGSPAVIIGAMVIAPLLGPNVALSLATTLGDLPLLRKSLLTGSIGILMTVVFSLVVGLFLQIDPALPEIQSRTRADLANVLLALSAGSAGALAFTTGLSTALIGVMTAVALLPPLVVFGLLAGAGHYSLARGAALLFSTNLICINLAGVLTFLIQGIRPLSWWDKERARRMVWIAFALWTFSLLALIVVTVLSRRLD
jgi:uncharacterized hydrophobic protein (TIGR00341 family)